MQIGTTLGCLEPQGRGFFVTCGYQPAVGAALQKLMSCAASRSRLQLVGSDRAHKPRHLDAETVEVQTTPGSPPTPALCTLDLQLQDT